jgi:hypothetical protein
MTKCPNFCVSSSIFGLSDHFRRHGDRNAFEESEALSPAEVCDLRTRGSGDAGSPVVEAKKVNAFRLSLLEGAGGDGIGGEWSDDTPVVALGETE